MNAGSTERCALTIAALLLGCERLSVDPPPPPSRHEIPAAPPAAVGAHAASRAALPLQVEQAAPSQEAPDSESEGGEAVPGPDAGSDSSGHAPEPPHGHPPEPEGVAL